jgi:hypothetical protein
VASLVHALLLRLLLYLPVVVVLLLPKLAVVL